MAQIFPGEHLELAIRRSGVSISEVAKQMHVNRRTVYHWFQQPSLRNEIVNEVGYIIRHDFSKEFPELINEGGFEATQNKLKETEKDQFESSTSIQYWMLKYIELLEKYNQQLANLKDAKGNREPEFTS